MLELERLRNANQLSAEIAVAPWGQAKLRWVIDEKRPSRDHAFQTDGRMRWMTRGGRPSRLEDRRHQPGTH